MPFAFVATAALVAFVALRRPSEPLTEQALRAAEARWRERGPTNYDLALEIGGGQEGAHEIQVREGRVTRMTTGGKPVPESVWAFWSVEGMFKFLAQELENARNPQRAHGVSDPAAVTLRVQFDADLGYPRYFLRHVTGRQSQIWWGVTSLEPGPPTR